MLRSPCFGSCCCLIALIVVPFYVLQRDGRLKLLASEKSSLIEFQYLNDFYLYPQILDFWISASTNFRCANFYPCSLWCRLLWKRRTEVISLTSTRKSEFKIPAVLSHNQVVMYDCNILCCPEKIYRHCSQFLYFHPFGITFALCRFRIDPLKFNTLLIGESQLAV